MQLAILVGLFLIALTASANFRSFSNYIETGTFSYGHPVNSATITVPFLTPKTNSFYNYAFSFQQITLDQKWGVYQFLMNVQSQTTTQMVLNMNLADPSTIKTIMMYLVIQSSFQYLAVAHLLNPYNLPSHLSSTSNFTVPSILSNSVSMTSALLPFVNGLTMTKSTANRTGIFVKAYMVATTSINILVYNSLAAQCTVTDFVLDVLAYDVDLFMSDFNDEVFQYSSSASFYNSPFNTNVHTFSLSINSKAFFVGHSSYNLTFPSFGSSSVSVDFAFSLGISNLGVHVNNNGWSQNQQVYPSYIQFQTIPNCTAPSFWVQAAQQCQSCAVGYYDLNFTCASCSSAIQYCLDCSSSSVCDTCDYSLIFSGGSCVPACGYANCVSCNFSIAAGIACSSCSSGYTLNPNNQTQCFSCPTGTYLDITTFTCYSCSSMQYCTNCSSSSVCNTCSYGLTFSGGSCVAICSDPNCLSCTFAVATGVACSSCSNGYGINPNNQTQCVFCSTGTYFNATTLTCDSCSSIQYCTDCSSSSVCNTCNYSLTFSGGSCIPVCSDPNCLTCAFSVATGITCSSCSYGYGINPNNQTQCLFCSTGTFYNSTTFTCDSCSSIQYCYDCSSSSVCNVCNYDLTLIGNSCIPVCSDPNCLSCTFAVATGIACASCTTGYVVTSATSCVTFCGDGIIAGSEECDDSNAVDGDGCSASCKFEQYFVCVNSPSECTLFINISVICVVKVEGCNQFTVTLQLNPQGVSIYKTLNWTLGFDSSYSSNVIQADYDQSDYRLRVTYSYNQSIQDLTNVLNIYPSQISTKLVSFANTSILLPQNTQNNQSMELFSDSQYALAKAVKYLAYAISALSLILYFVGYFGGKLIAIECLAVVQLSGMLLLALKNMKPAMAALYPLAVSMGLIPLSTGYIYEISDLHPNLKLLFVQKQLFKGQNVFLLLVVVPILVALILKLLSDSKFKDKPILKLAWKNSLGTFTFYGILMVAYGQFCYLFTNIKYFSGAFVVSLVICLLFTVLTAVYIVALIKLPRWFGSFKNKFLKFDISGYLYVFSTVERLLTPAILVLLGPFNFAPLIVGVILVLEAIFIGCKHAYLLNTWKRPMVNKILAVIICILTTCAGVFQSSTVVQMLVPIVIELILIAILTYSTYFVIKQCPSHYEEVKLRTQNAATAMQLKQCQKKQIQDFAVKMLPEEYWPSQQISADTTTISQSNFKWYWENYCRLYSVSILETSNIVKKKPKDKENGQELKEIRKSQSFLESSL